jgi:hypothetical protein
LFVYCVVKRKCSGNSGFINQAFEMASF